MPSILLAAFVYRIVANSSPVLSSTFMSRSGYRGVFAYSVKLGRFGNLLRVNYFSVIAGALYAIRSALIETNIGS